jgi:quinol monooxygenase YgiN
MARKFVLSVYAAALALPLMTAAVAQTPTSAGDVTVFTIIDVVPDYALPHNVEKATALLSKLVEDTQHAQGLVSFKVLKDRQRDNHFVMEAVWKDMKSFELYSGAETTRAFRQAFQPTEPGPFDERIYVDLKPAP